jgi:Holliday junction resolvase RusA-like endonuclease
MNVPIRNVAADVRTIPLQKPISVNGMYRNARGRGRVKTERYKTWRQAAGWEAKSSGPLRPVKGPVHITLYVSEDGVRNMDLDNTAKGYLDLFVTLGVIEDDNRKIVRSLNLSWVSGPGYAIIQSIGE